MDKHFGLWRVSSGERKMKVGGERGREMRRERGGRGGGRMEEKAMGKCGEK